jgi:flagellar L-ring protein precursor FlgH
MNHFIKLVIITTLLTGCASTKQASVLPNDPEFAPILPEPRETQVVPTGSLFNVHYVNNIYSDAKAHRVGDIISVILSESTQAQKSAKTELKKEDSVALSPITGSGANSIRINGQAIELGIDQKNNFKGDSKSNQGNSLSGNISVSVIQVLDNGNLVIRGEKWMTLNNGDEYIRLTGVIRPTDIAADNTVLSSKVANARIQYSGTGTFAEVNQQGWLSRFFNSTWWPF